VGIPHNWVICPSVSVPCSVDRQPLSRRKTRISKFTLLTQRRARRFRNPRPHSIKTGTRGHKVGHLSSVFISFGCLIPSATSCKKSHRSFAASLSKSFNICCLFSLSIVFLFSCEFTHQSVCPSVLPCLGTLAYYLGGVAAQLLMYAGMACEAQSTQIVDIECQSLHLVFGSCCLDRHDMMHAASTRHDALLHALFAQSVGASELGSSQLLPLSAVVDVGLVLCYLIRYPSPVSLLTHIVYHSTPMGLQPSASRYSNVFGSAGGRCSAGSSCGNM